MGLLKRKYDDEEGLDRTDCYCKFRGTEAEKEYYRRSQEEPAKSHENVSEKHCDGDCDCDGNCGDACKCKPKPQKRNLVEDMTFGELVGLLNHLAKEIQLIKERLDGRP